MKKIIKPVLRPTALFLGEGLAFISRVAGNLAARLLYFAQWRLAIPEWFDGRLTQLSPGKWGNDLHHVIYANVLEVLPVGGRLLDICSGDAFIPYNVYSLKAGQIVCVDYDANAAAHARKFHSKSNIKYLNRSIFEFDGQDNSFDVVVVRGAIEHFTQAQQQQIFSLAKRLLKPGGYFCGDTPANAVDGDKLLDSHEYEWRDEQQMRAELAPVFSEIETKVYLSREPADRTIFRTSLIWRCPK